MKANKELDCKICLCDFEVDDPIRRLPCLHFFHTDCVDQWFRGSVCCPICREEVR